MLELMPQPRRPDYQPPQTLACHGAPRESHMGGCHVTATPQPLGVKTGGLGALLQPPSYRWRTVKGHSLEVLQVYGEAAYGWVFVREMHLLLSFWEL